MRHVLLLFALCAILTGGCGGSEDCPANGTGIGSTCGQTASPSPTAGTATSKGQLYLSNGGNSLLRFLNATTVNGDVVPEATIQGGLTKLNTPLYLTYDATNDRLYVPNTGDNQILVFDRFSTLRENVPPTRFISGPNTLLNRPLHIQIDTSKDLMYVANSGAANILVFSNASTIQGSIAPTRNIGGQNTQLVGGLRSLWLDQANDRLYAINEQSSGIFVFNSASTQNGDPFPNRRITGQNTQLAQPQALFIDGSDRMFVSCAGSNAILRFANASTIDGPIAPTAIVSGQATELTRPSQMWFDTEGTLYVLNNQGVLMFNKFAEASGGPPPNRRLTGGRTKISTPPGMVLDLTH